MNNVLNSANNASGSAYNVAAHAMKAIITFKTPVFKPVLCSKCILKTKFASCVTSLVQSAMGPRTSNAIHAKHHISCKKDTVLIIH